MHLNWLSQHTYISHLEWCVSRCGASHSFPCALLPGEWQLMPSVPRALSTLTHNPLLLCSTDSTEREREINSLHTPKSASTYLHKDIKETEGEQRRAYGVYSLQYASHLCLLNNFPRLTCFSFIFIADSKHARSLESFLRMLVQQQHDRFV